MAQGRNSWLALGTAGAIGAAAMYGVSRMNRNGGMQQVAQNVRNSKAMQSAQSYMPGMGNDNEADGTTIYSQ